MRFRLRTLMVVVTLCSVPLGWIAWLRQAAAFHRGESERFAAIIQSAETPDSGDPRGRIQLLAANASVTKCVVVRQDDGEIVGFLKNGRTTTYAHPTVTSAWRPAVYHSIMAARYEQAVYRPWILQSPVETSKDAVRVPLADDTWKGLSRSVMTEIDHNH